MKKNKIQIYINGKKKNINSNCNLIDILKEYSLINKLILGYTLIEIYTERSIDSMESISFIKPLE